MDTNPSDRAGPAVRAAFADELREQTTEQRRAALCCGAAGAAGLCAGAAIVGCLVLLVGAVAPAWAAAPAAAAVLLRSAARRERVPSASAPGPSRDAADASAGTRHRCRVTLMTLSQVFAHDMRQPEGGRGRDDQLNQKVRWR